MELPSSENDREREREGDSNLTVLLSKTMQIVVDLTMAFISSAHDG